MSLEKLARSKKLAKYNPRLFFAHVRRNRRLNRRKLARGADHGAFVTGFLNILRAAFNFGRLVHFALRGKMLKPPIARLPAIKMDFINRPS